MVSIHKLSETLLKGKIPASGLEKLSRKSSSIENIVQKLTGDNPSVNLKELNLSLLKNYLPEKIPLGKALGNLYQFLSSASNKNIKSQSKETLKHSLENIIIQKKDIDENVLKNILDKTGLNYEANLKKLVLSKAESTALSSPLSEKQITALKSSLKGQLLKLAQELEEKMQNIQHGQKQPEVKELHLLLKNVKSALTNIELNQIFNYYSMREDGSFQIQIPYSLSETIYIYIKDNSNKKKQKESEKEDSTLVFLLNLKGIGNLRVDVQVFKDTISCHFFAEDKNVSEFISTILPELKQSLEKNYAVSHLSCVVKKKKFFEEEKPEKKLFQKKTQIINVKA